MKKYLLKVIQLLSVIVMPTLIVASSTDFAPTSNRVQKTFNSSIVKIEFLSIGYTGKLPEKITAVIAVEKEGSNSYFQQEVIVSNGIGFLRGFFTGKCELRIQPTECTSYFHTNLVISSSEQISVVIPVLPVFSVFGRVVGESTAPIESAEVILCKNEIGEEQPDVDGVALIPPIIINRVFSDKTGNFKFDGVGSGKYTIFVRGSQHSITHKTFTVKDKNLAIGNITLNSGEKIRGRITDSDERPIGNIVVCLKDSELKLKPYSPWSTFLATISDSNGDFVFSNLEAGIYKIEIYERNNENSTIPIAVLDSIKSSTEPVRIAIERGLPCLFQITDYTNNPLENAFCDFELVSELGLKKVGAELTDNEGKITRALMENSVYRLSVFKYGYMPTNILIDTSEIKLSSSGFSFNIALNKGNALNGCVLDYTTKKSAGKGLIVWCDLWDSSALDWQTPNTPYITSYEGCFKLEGLPEGLIPISIYKLKNNILHCIGKTTINFDPRTTNQINLYISSLGAVTGYIASTANEPIRQGKILLIKDDDETRRIKYYGEILDGSFNIDELLPGKYRLLIWIFQTNSQAIKADERSSIYSLKDLIMIDPQKTNTLFLPLDKLRSSETTNSNLE